jgi:hypothetical protein
MILAVGYRVRSLRGAQFRRWATERLREYLVKGFTLDDERLKEGRKRRCSYSRSTPWETWPRTRETFQLFRIAPTKRGISLTR